MGVDIQTYRATIGTYRHSHGVNVVTVVCLVNFSSGLKSVGCVLFIGILLIMGGVEQNPGPRTSDERRYETQLQSDAVQDSTVENVQPTKIKVIGLPTAANDEFLLNFFENENRQGVGKVKHVEVDDEENSAIVEFEDASAVVKLMQKQPITILKMKVNVEVLGNTILGKCTAEPGQVEHVSGYITAGTRAKSDTTRINWLYDSQRSEPETESVPGKCAAKPGQVEHLTGYITAGTRAKSNTTKTSLLFDSQRSQPKTESVPGKCTAKPGQIEHLSGYTTARTRAKSGTTKTRWLFNSQRSEPETESVPDHHSVTTVEHLLPSGKYAAKPGQVEYSSGYTTARTRGMCGTIKTSLLLDSQRSEPKTESVPGKCKAKPGQVEHLSGYTTAGTRAKSDITKSSWLYDSQRSEPETESVPVLTVNKQKTSRSPSVETLANADQNSSDEIDTTATYGTKHLRTQFDTRMCRVQVKAESRTDEKESEGKAFHQFLSKLGLENKYPGMISIQDVIAIDENEATDQEKTCISLADLPWMMLKRLICAHSESRDITASDEKNTENSMDEDNILSFAEPENHDISPLDVFIVLFQCCDPFLKQLIFQKMYLCKIAVPFLYKIWKTKESCEPVIAVWPLRSLTIDHRLESDSSQSKSIEVDSLELETKVVAFTRFGRPCFSKSKLLNSLLTSKGCDTFFNIDCPSGMTPRNLSSGQIEMFWLPTTGGKKDIFKEAMTFLNMRGDLNTDFDVAILSFISNFVDAITIIIDINSISEKAKEVKGVLLNFSSIILVIADPLTPNEIEAIKRFRSEVVESKPDINICVTSSHKAGIKQNAICMTTNISKCIMKLLGSKTTKSAEERLTYVTSGAVKTDEQEGHFEHGKTEAQKLLKQMKQDGKSRYWKHCLTPVHSASSRQLGKLIKERKRENDFMASEHLNSKIKIVRQNQTQSITKTVKLFIDILLKNEESNLKIKLILCWLHFYIEREKRTVLPHLMHENRCAWKKLKELKSKEIKVSEEIKNQETIIKRSEDGIEEASFSVEYLFREIGHIYEAILELNEDASKFELPSLDRIAKIVGKLVADGHQLDLIDGESFYMPFSWIQAVLKQVEESIASSKVMTLSVLGLQSSGKSTLLNTMFGSQFSTRSGRCTKGIHIKLIPVNKISHRETSTPFTYILLADTEGLRSPELNRVRHEHDNELATVITGIGDITLLNVMGENTSEIRDILQIIVHALLRLKMANKNLDITKSCAFIHQNVTDTSASENMLSGLGKLIQTLDEMTKESARSEGILDITTFNQVIEFDINSQVWYLKNLWQGNPPMAKVNNEYSEHVVDIKCKILQKALQVKNKSYKSLSDFLEHAHSLWKGVLEEDFVFSFRNSLEIRAYTEMEKVVQDELWRLESAMCDRLVGRTQTAFASCDQKANLRQIANQLKRDLTDKLADERTRTEEVIKTYFEMNDKYKEIISQWKKGQYTRIEFCCEKLGKRFVEHIDKSLGKRSVEILTVANHKKHEEKLSKESMEVANRNKDNTLTENEIEDLFENIWQEFITNVETCGYFSEQSKENMQEIFESYLKEEFKRDNALLQQALNEQSKLMPLPNLEKLGGSFQSSGVTKSDISLTTTWQKFKNNLPVCNVLQHVTDRVNQIFVVVDEKIKRLCQVNEEITEITVNTLMHELKHSIHDIVNGKVDYDFKTPFYIKAFVHVSRYAYPKFEMHNKTYFKKHGSAALLEQYRMQQKIRFVAHINNRKSEDTAARLFSHAIENFAEEWISLTLTNKVNDELYRALPSVKNRVIIEICTNLLDKENFGTFILYLQAPKEYASLWITDRANSHLFAETTRAYATIALSLSNVLFEDVKTSVRNLRSSYTKTSPPTMRTWIKEFRDYLKERNISIKTEIFRVLDELMQIQNIDYLTNVILDNLLKSEESVTALFRRQTSATVKWTDTNPIDRIITQIWGCSEQCPFCGEPCAKTDAHDDSVHYSIQHRPSCCNGIRDIHTHKAFLESCDFDVQSNKTHKCDVFKYICNKDKRSTCDVKMHSYRDYKTYFPKWDIPPTPSMHDTSKFWMWFVATYKTELKNYYEYEVDNIPSSWNEITKDEAKKSLMKTYSA